MKHILIDVNVSVVIGDPIAKTLQIPVHQHPATMELLVTIMDPTSFVLVLVDFKELNVNTI